MWPKVSWETRDWERDPDARMYISKTRRRKILSTYEAAIPPVIASETVTLSPAILEQIAEVTSIVTRFDQAQAARGYDLPALMLRSESSSSSQIERLTSSVRNVALAEVSSKAPANAKLIARNVVAMREAIEQEGPITQKSICHIHDVLMNGTGERDGIRDEQVWIGGTSYSPHGAQFVPPHPSRVRECLDDLVRFGMREDITPIAKVAIFHAQFETIHPFTDGNGRTGRALLHRMLAYDDVLMHTTLPISAGLLHDVDTYMEALASYHEGEVEPIVKTLVNALELSVFIGGKIARRVDEIVEEWQSLNTDRAGSASYRLPSLLIEHPVVDVSLVASDLGTTDRAARSIVERACERGILTRMGNARRGVLYQASDIIDVLEEVPNLPDIRRMS